MQTARPLHPAEQPCAVHQPCVVCKDISCAAVVSTTLGASVVACLTWLAWCRTTRRTLTGTTAGRSPNRRGAAGKRALAAHAGAWPLCLTTCLKVWRCSLVLCCMMAKPAHAFTHPLLPDSLMHAKLAMLDNSVLQDAALTAVQCLAVSPCNCCGPATQWTALLLAPSHVHSHILTHTWLRCRGTGAARQLWRGDLGP